MEAPKFLPREDLYVWHIEVDYGYSGMSHWGWKVTARWMDTRFAENGTLQGVIGTLQGVIETRYHDTHLGDALNEILTVARQSHIEIGSHARGNYLPPRITLSTQGAAGLPVQLLVNMDVGWQKNARAVLETYGWADAHVFVRESGRQG